MSLCIELAIVMLLMLLLMMLMMLMMVVRMVVVGTWRTDHMIDNVVVTVDSRGRRAVTARCTAV